MKIENRLEYKNQNGKLIIVRNGNDIEITTIYNDQILPSIIDTIEFKKFITSNEGIFKINPPSNNIIEIINDYVVWIEFTSKNTLEIKYYSINHAIQAHQKGNKQPSEQSCFFSVVLNKKEIKKLLKYFME